MQDHSTIMRILINIRGICSHMMLKDREEWQDKLTKALSNAAASPTCIRARLNAFHDQEIPATKAEHLLSKTSG